MNTSETIQKLLEVIFLLLGFLTPIAVLSLWWRQRKARRLLEQQSDFGNPLIGTKEDLRAAEESLRLEPLNIREKLFEQFTVIERFTTRMGYSQAYMDDLVRFLENEGISCTSHFQESVPLGAVGSITERHGIFELYVQPDQVDLARLAIERFKAETSKRP